MSLQLPAEDSLSITVVQVHIDKVQDNISAIAAYIYRLKARTREYLFPETTLEMALICGRSDHRIVIAVVIEPPRAQDC